MGSSTLQKLVRTQSQSAIKVLTHFNKPSPFLLTQIPKISQPVCSGHHESDFPKPNPSISSYAYPSFSFGFFLNPNPALPLIRSVPDDDFTMPEDSRTIRADSVKKKRKKKMNKHKLRKLRKRLRRKT